MDELSIRNVIIKCLEENGINWSEDGELEEFDSIMFVSTIVELENRFGMSIPDEYLLVDYFKSVDDIVETVQLILTDIEK